MFLSILDKWSSMSYFYIDIAICLLILVFLLTCFIVNSVSITLIVQLIFFVMVGVVINIFDFSMAEIIMHIGLQFYIILLFAVFTKRDKSSLLIRNKKNKKTARKLSVDKANMLFDLLEKTVSDLSATKTGALITIEKKDDLEHITINSGVKINAPVSPELLETIFFDKTPLHDGASIIKGNVITKSAVFYQPTQRPLNGKFGSRHRAALGISEISDAITIVVSEETGRVSIAYKGELIKVPVTEFKQKLEELYNN